MKPNTKATLLTTNYSKDKWDSIFCLKEIFHSLQLLCIQFLSLVSERRLVWTTLRWPFTKSDCHKVPLNWHKCHSAPPSRPPPEMKSLQIWKFRVKLDFWTSDFKVPLYPPPPTPGKCKVGISIQLLQRDASPTQGDLKVYHLPHSLWMCLRDMLFTIICGRFCGKLWCVYSPSITTVTPSIHQGSIVGFKTAVDI